MRPYGPVASDPVVGNAAAAAICMLADTSVEKTATTENLLDPICATSHQCHTHTHNPAVNKAQRKRTNQKAQTTPTGHALLHGQ